MTVGAGIAVQEDGSLVALGATVLMEVRGNVLVTPAAGGGMLNGAFLGVRSAPACSRSVFPVEKLSPCATRWTSMSRAGPLSRKASCRTWRTCPSEGPMKLVGQCQMCSHVLNNVM